MHNQDCFDLTINFLTGQNSPIKKNTLFGELFSEIKKNELNCLWPSVYVFSLSLPLLIGMHSGILASLEEKQAIKKISRDQQFIGMTFKQHLFTYLRNKYYCLLCTNFDANIWEYYCGPGR